MPLLSAGAAGVRFGPELTTAPLRHRWMPLKLLPFVGIARCHASGAD